MLPNETDMFFLEILLHNSKPIMQKETIYGFQSQSNILETLNDNMDKIDSVNNETYLQSWS